MESVSMMTIHNVWMMVCIFLVFIMHLGFASLESGLTQSKNTVNILFKNTLIPAIGLLTYAAWGFQMMYPESWIVDGWFAFKTGILESGNTDVLVSMDGAPYAEGKYSRWTDFLFQGMFAATAATIVSGAVAERVKLGPFLLFSILFVGFAYPMIGSWHWGKGWLYQMNFYDFAGSTLVHAVGGAGALAGAMLLGPRIGKFEKGITLPIRGHSMPLAAIGVFLLWLGWFGFNGGSVLSADPESVSLVLVTTCLAAAAGAVSAALTDWFITKKPDLSMTLNGVLAGLVGITAGADQMSPLEAVAIGLISGVLCIGAVILFDKLKIDDPVGAISVHLICGFWGTLAVGIFGDMASPKQFSVQLIGGFTCITVSFIIAYALFLILKKTTGIRVSREEELEGLDVHEHGMNAYDI